MLIALPKKKIVWYIRKCRTDTLTDCNEWKVEKDIKFLCKNGKIISHRNLKKKETIENRVYIDCVVNSRKIKKKYIVRK